MNQFYLTTNILMKKIASILVKDADKSLPRIIHTLSKNGINAIHYVDLKKSSLEDVFLDLTGKGINE